MKLEDIRRIVVVGAGTMGHSIAQVFAQRGYEVRLVDREEGILERAMETIGGNLKTLASHGLLDRSEAPEILQRISTTTSLKEGATESDLAVEAVFEDPAIKKTVFAELDRHCPKRTILTSNTSTLDIYGIVETGRPEKVVIAHWFAPPHIIPLVEVVQGEKTSRATIDLVMALLTRVGKRPVYIQQFMPAFIVNRIQLAISHAVFEILDNGWASPEEIDLAVKASLGIRLPIVGVVQTMDFAGLDLLRQINILQGTPRKILEERVEKGHLGVKSGKGIYDYQGRGYEEVFGKRDDRYLKMVQYLDELNAYEPI